ncbi:MAG: formimidoylglutamase [Bacteroidetes bacterium]|nr:formimidoylglutamase [Bacteroidota bacterium]MBL0018005.1 formimidoylglutamase [Bacteroidota bacterium]
MDIESLFRPLEPKLIQKRLTLDDHRLSDFTKFNFGEFPYWQGADIVIVGCPEDRGARGLTGSAMAPDQIRRHLYALAAPKRDLKIVDLGNMVKADRMIQYYDRIADVVEEVVKAGKLLIFLGGSQDIVYGQYKGYQKLTDSVEYVCIDSQLDVEDSDFGIHHASYNHKIFLHSPNYLSNFTNLGYQSYFVPLSQKVRLRNLYFQGLRLGELRTNLREAEPFLRNASMVSFDMSAVRSGDAPGTANPSPAGFTAEEICQLARYTGMSNRVSSVSITEILPMRDFNAQTTLLGSMLVWYLIEGFLSRRIDEPEDLSRLIKYSVSLQGGIQNLVFYKNPLSERWWMEVPYSEGMGRREGRTELVPCSESDYELARQDEIPEKWWLAHYKLK